MVSVTKRVRSIKQPYGGYVPAKSFKVLDLDDGKILHPEETTSPQLIGTTVDYLTRFMLENDVQGAFDVALRGASIVDKLPEAKKNMESIIGLDDWSIENAVYLAHYDSAYRVGPLFFQPLASENEPSLETIDNIKVMVERSLSVFKEYGPVTRCGFTMPGAYTDMILAGDGDFLTENVLWDMKVSTSPRIDKNVTLQLLVYYLMGRRSTDPAFDTISTLGVFNPRLNKVYYCNIADIPSDVVSAVEKEVIGYE